MGLALLENLLDDVQTFLAFFLHRCHGRISAVTPIVKAACRDFQDATHHGDRPMVAMFVDPGVPHGYIVSLALCY